MRADNIIRVLRLRSVNLPRRKKAPEGQMALRSFMVIPNECSMCKGTCEDIGKLLYRGSLRYGHQKRDNCCHCRIAMDKELWCNGCKKRNIRKPKIADIRIRSKTRTNQAHRSSRPARKTRLFG